MNIEQAKKMIQEGNRLGDDSLIEQGFAILEQITSLDVEKKPAKKKRGRPKKKVAKKDTPKKTTSKKATIKNKASFTTNTREQSSQKRRPVLQDGFNNQFIDDGTQFEEDKKVGKLIKSQFSERRDATTYIDVACSKCGEEESVLPIYAPLVMIEENGVVSSIRKYTCTTCLRKLKRRR